MQKQPLWGLISDGGGAGNAGNLISTPQSLSRADPAESALGRISRPLFLATASGNRTGLTRRRRRWHGASHRRELCLHRRDRHALQIAYSDVGDVTALGRGVRGDLAQSVVLPPRLGHGDCPRGPPAVFFPSAHACSARTLEIHCAGGYPYRGVYV